MHEHFVTEHDICLSVQAALITLIQYSQGLTFGDLKIIFLTDIQTQAYAAFIAC